MSVEREIETLDGRKVLTSIQNSIDEFASWYEAIVVFIHFAE